MGGKQLTAATRDTVLSEVESWAARELGDLGEVAAWDERYVLEGVRIAVDRPGARRAEAKHSGPSG